MKLKLLLLIPIIIVINGCSIFGGSNSLDKMVQTFYVGDAGTQYYVRPIQLSTEKDENMLMDITFRYKDEIKDSATINFTLISEELFKKIESIQINNSSHNFVSKELTLLYAEREGDNFKARFSYQCPMTNLDTLIRNPNWVVTIMNNSKEYQYLASSEAKTVLKTLDDDLFVIFR